MDRYFYSIEEEISILALVWRATLLGSVISEVLEDFNPRPRVEGDV